MSVTNLSLPSTPPQDGLSGLIGPLPNPMSHRPANGNIDKTQRVQRLRGKWRRLIPDRRAELCPSVRFLMDRGYDFSTLLEATRQSIDHGTDAATEMISRRQLIRDEYDRAIADAAGLAYVEADEIKSVLARLDQSAVLLHNHGLHWCRLSDDRLCAVATVRPQEVERFISFVRRSNLRARLAVSSPEHVKAHFLSSRAAHLRAQTSAALFNRAPKSSALSGADFSQGVLLTVLIAVLFAGFLLGPTLEGLIIHILLSLFFISCVIMRLGASMHRSTASAQHVQPSEDASKPVYTVLVTLLDEAAVVPGLVHHLSELSWPATKLEIKLICEAHDTATLEALGRHHLDSRFEVIIVPPGGPKTKPNALCYAMAFCSGELVTLYDAEDRPHPMQLEEAWQRFADEPATLGCLQAPLEIANARTNTFTALFHMEYAGLFKRILPWLAERHLPLPLGGTSNHFRRSALDDIGLWDPHNVTEDADLGYRLWERGYQTGTLTLPTLEDAPETFDVWLPQRTRWFKGWMQTWLVHSRQAGAMIRRHGVPRFLMAHIVLSGVLISALLHPLVLMNAIAMTLWLAGGASATGNHTALLLIDSATVLVSYGAFCVLGIQATDPKTRPTIKHYAWLTPIYWMAMSWAAWRALLQMFTAPFLWEKTPHKPYAFDPKALPQKS